MKLTLEVNQCEARTIIRSFAGNAALSYYLQALGSNQDLNKAVNKVLSQHGWMTGRKILGSVRTIGTSEAETIIEEELELLMSIT